MDGILSVVDLELGTVVSGFRTEASRILASPVIAGGVLYVGSTDGYLYALQ